MKYEKSKLFRNKKAINDVSILTIISLIFLLTSVIVPFVNAEFPVSSIDVNQDGIVNQIRDGSESVSSVSAFTILITFLKLATFDWGNTLNLPFWLDLLYVLLAVIFILTIVRNIWFGGGG